MGIAQSRYRRRGRPQHEPTARTANRDRISDRLSLAASWGLDGPGTAHDFFFGVARGAGVDVERRSAAHPLTRLKLPHRDPRRAAARCASVRSRGHDHDALPQAHREEPLAETLSAGTQLSPERGAIRLASPRDACAQHRGRPTERRRNWVGAGRRLRKVIAPSLRPPRHLFSAASDRVGPLSVDRPARRSRIPV